MKGACLHQVFMLEAQWRLTIVTFVSVPVTIIIMKVSSLLSRTADIVKLRAML